MQVAEKQKSSAIAKLVVTPFGQFSNQFLRDLKVLFELQSLIEEGLQTFK
jgi:hypothetical protein